jgi:hypothetical protein
MRRPLALALLVALVALVAVAGCSCVQRPHYEPLHADSSATVPVDSLAIIVRNAQAMWDAPAGGEEAARVSARLVLNDLVIHSRVEPTLSWEGRARTLLDSLGFGAEIASDRCVLVVNFFSRSDPDQGAWPWLFWCGDRGILSQPLESRGLKLVALTSRGLYGDPPTPPGSPAVAILFGRRSAGGQQPMLMAWDLSGGNESLAQTLGPDSLGGVGKGQFIAPDDTTIELTTRTYRASARFDECSTCPHVWQLRRFHWGPAGFMTVSEQTEPSPYATFVQFVQAIAVDDRDAAKALVTDPAWVEVARRSKWNEIKGNWRVAPSTDETAHEMVFFRGQQEAYRVTFEPNGADWLISGFRSTSATIE